MVEQKFCVKNSPTNDVLWTSGNYCIYRKGGKCPSLFKEGFVQYCDHPTEATPNAQSGELPDGVYGDNTRFEYCCTNTGFSDVHELYLPSIRPFVLIHGRKKACQRVRGMHTETTTLLLGNANASQTQPAVGGDHPVDKINEKKRTFSTKFCVYKPAMINRGDLIELDYSNSEVRITSPKAPELEFYWLIKGPPGERLHLDFDSFDIKGTPKNCVDNLEVRHVRPGQPGWVYCGSRWDHTTISINNTIHMRLSTYGNSSSLFTIKLVKNADLCYAASDRGMTYNGDVNFTRQFEPCLPWVKVSHCEMHPFRADRFTTTLEGNKCRNPDQGTGFYPWCYTHANGCLRNYCDVCLLGKRYDLLENCAQIKASGQCSLQYCAKTCVDHFSEPSVPVKASEVSCGPPGPVPDGAPVETSKTNYSVGESVTYKCNYLVYTTKRFCLTSGQWSAMGTSCSECPDGYTANKENKQCYYYPNLVHNYTVASQHCKENENAVVAFPLSEKENSYLRNFTSSSMWIGITDEVEEGNFLTALGEPIHFSKWADNQPNNKKKEDCTEMKKDGTWDDTRCERERHYVCQRSWSSLKDCLDRSDKCSELFAQNPSSCVDFPTFAETHCRFTCGLCDIQGTPQCQVDEAGVPSELNRGATLTATCEESYTGVAGDAVRGCTASGSLSGSPLECEEFCPWGWTLNQDSLHCYRQFETPKTNSEAQAECERLEGILVTAKDLTETEFILSFKQSGSVWMGVSDAVEASQWIWADGTQVLWSNWKGEEPSDIPGNDCAVFRDSGKWLDTSCNDTYLFMCKVPLKISGQTEDKSGDERIDTTIQPQGTSEGELKVTTIQPQDTPEGELKVTTIQPQGTSEGELKLTTIQPQGTSEGELKVITIQPQSTTEGELKAATSKPEDKLGDILDKVIDESKDMLEDIFSKLFPGK